MILFFHPRRSAKNLAGLHNSGRRQENDRLKRRIFPRRMATPVRTVYDPSERGDERRLIYHLICIAGVELQRTTRSGCEEMNRSPLIRCSSAKRPSAARFWPGIFGIRMRNHSHASAASAPPVSSFETAASNSSFEQSMPRSSRSSSTHEQRSGGEIGSKILMVLLDWNDKAWDPLTLADSPLRDVGCSPHCFFLSRKKGQRKSRARLSVGGDYPIRQIGTA